jgi:hypothetical protein
VPRESWRRAPHIFCRRRGATCRSAAPRTRRHGGEGDEERRFDEWFRQRFPRLRERRRRGTLFASQARTATFLKPSMPPHRLRIALISEHASPLKALGGIHAGGQNVARAVLFVLTMPRASIVPEVLPLEEASWP